MSNPKLTKQQHITIPKHQKLIVASLLAIIFVSVAIFLLKDLFKSKDEYIRQESLFEDDFFNSTPRVSHKEKVIIIYRDGGFNQITEVIDHNGDTIDRKDKFISLEANKYVKRGDSIIRTGEEILPDDYIDDGIFYKDGKPYKKKRIYRNGEFAYEEEPLENTSAREVSESKLSKDGELIKSGDNFREYLTRKADGTLVRITETLDKDGKVISREEAALSDKGVKTKSDKDTIVRIFIDEDGKIKKLIQTLGINGDIVMEELIDLDEIKNEESLKAEKVVKKTPPKKRFFKSKQPQSGISERERKIAEINRRRVSSGKIFKVDQNRNVKEYVDTSQDSNYEMHGVPSTTASYPVDLKRVITMDKIIPAVLITEIKSELASQKVLAQVETDVVGSHGRLILIPRGSKAIGAYIPLSEAGSRRLGIRWYRIITPEGINIKLEAELQDAEGSAGITGEMDRRIKDKYLAAILYSTISASAQLSVPVDNERAKAAADAYSRALGDVTIEALKDSLDVTPRIRIPKGTNITISPLSDIWFKKPRGKFVEVKKVNKL